jgi:hypothetical protein
VRDLVNLRAPVTSRSDDQGPRKTETLPLPLDGDAAAVQRAAEAAEAANPPDLPAALTNWARAERLYDAAGKIAERDYAAIQRFNLGNAVPQDVALRAWRAAQAPESGCLVKCPGMEIASAEGKRQRKRFFFEKKNQKTLTHSG